MNQVPVLPLCHPVYLGHLDPVQPLHSVLREHVPVRALVVVPCQYGMNRVLVSRDLSGLCQPRSARLRSYLYFSLGTNDSYTMSVLSRSASISESTLSFFSLAYAIIATSESLFRLKPSNRKQYGSPLTPVRHGQNKARRAGESVQERKESKGGCKDARCA